MCSISPRPRTRKSSRCIPSTPTYVFMGRDIDMRGQSHPPLNAWFLALLIAAGRGVSEIPFHAAYILFSLIAAFSALALARRFSPHPLLATLLFCATPAFVINGTSLEADLPFVALWLLSTALYVFAVDRNSIPLLIASSIAMALAALTAYQSILLVPILFLYGRKWRPARIAALHPHRRSDRLEHLRAPLHGRPAGRHSCQLHDRLRAPGFHAKNQKRRRAHRSSGVAGLPELSGFRPLSRAPLRHRRRFLRSEPALLGIHRRRRRHPDLVRSPLARLPRAMGADLFRRSAGHLLRRLRPLPAPHRAAHRDSRHRARRPAPSRDQPGLRIRSSAWRSPWSTINIGTATASSRARSERRPQSKRLWINGEWGLRYYFESEGGLPLHQGQAIHPGEMVVSSKLSYPIPFTSGGGVLAPVAQRTITSSIPLRIVALRSRAAYSTTMLGLRPFDISLAPIDQLTRRT